MQLQRRYNLPNCTLLVDGLADTSGEPGYSQRLAVLMNMDCYLSGQQQPLSGGVDFLTALIQAVSHYAQQCLSGIPHRLAQSSQSPVRIVPLENDRHEIQIYPDPTLAPDPQASTDPQRIPLTTVQFFDLVEAVDQLLADPLTLPQLVVPLSPLSRQENADRVPLIERAATPTLGGLGLALAATAFFLSPTPDIQRPLVDPLPGEQASADNNNADATAGDSAQSADDPSPNNTNQGSSITDPDQLLDLTSKLYTQIDQAWEVPSGHDQNLVYQVSVDAQGQIRGYREENEVAAQFVQTTPLPDLLVPGDPATAADGEPLADFKVVFTPQGVLQINPWHGLPDDATPAAAQGEASPSTAPLSDDRVKDLTGSLYEALDTYWQSSPSFERNLAFRVRVNAQGKVVDFAPVTGGANNFLAELPLDQIKDSAASVEQTADFRVVFKPSGVLEVSPWDGF